MSDFNYVIIYLFKITINCNISGHIDNFIFSICK